MVIYGYSLVFSLSPPFEYKSKTFTRIFLTVYYLGWGCYFFLLYSSNIVRNHTVFHAIKHHLVNVWSVHLLSFCPIRCSFAAVLYPNSIVVNVAMDSFT